MEKKWAAENERIMREHAAEAPTSDPGVIEGEMTPIGQPPADEPSVAADPKPISLKKLSDPPSS
jgi:sec-independent protein translocase protein TatB